MEKNKVISLFGEETQTYIEVLDKISKAFDNTTYTYEFIDVNFTELFAQDTTNGMKIYWFEMLLHTHLAAATSLIRQNRWIDGMINSAVNENFFSFSACLRALIEASADKCDALQAIAATLANNYGFINQALKGNVNSIFTSQELEDKLIHYSHARKLNKKHNQYKSYQAKTSSEYIKNLELFINNNLIYQCYSELCEITHPSAQTVESFLAFSPENTIYLYTKKDVLLIENLAQSYASIFTNILTFGINPSILLLKTLNMFDIEQVQTPIANEINTDKIPLWHEIVACVESVRNI